MTGRGRAKCKIAKALALKRRVVFTNEAYTTKQLALFVGMRFAGNKIMYAISLYLKCDNGGRFISVESTVCGNARHVIGLETRTSMPLEMCTHLASILRGRGHPLSSRQLNRVFELR